MLCIFDGRPSLPIDAGIVRQAIISQVAIPESRPTYQERKEGHFDLTLDGSGDVTGESAAAGAPIRRFSTSLAGVTLADFPDNWAFGNGCTIAVMVPLSTGPRLLSWCVFDNSLAATVNANFAALQSLFEN